MTAMRRVKNVQLDCKGLQAKGKVYAVLNHNVI
jgi:hypothetical protein